MFDVMELVVREDRPGSDREWFAVDADVLYPAMVKRIREAVAENGLPQELVDVAPVSIEVDPAAAARRYYKRAKKVEEIAWINALRPRDDFADDSPVLVGRTEALELARMWFTRALKNGRGAVGIHILKGSGKYRL